MNRVTPTQTHKERRERVMVSLLGLFFEVRDARMHSDLNPGLQILRIILRRLAIVRSTGHWLPDFSLLNNDWSWSVSRVMSFVLESEKMLRRTHLNRC